jgi:predicted phage tail protein
MSRLATRGSKGSESAHEAVESPDSLVNTSYANILDAISEGPIVGLVNGAQSIYYDETPLANADGTLNFTGVTWEQRTGEAEQDYISGFPSVEAETSVGVELTFATSWTQAISNTELSAVRVRLGVSSLYQTEDDGDTVGYIVNYAIDLSTDNGDYVTVLTPAFDGKTTGGYQRSHRIDLPEADEGWQIRVRRLTADATDSKIQANTSIVSYTEVIDAKLQYPYTALIGTKIDASQFSSIPERAFRIKGRIVQVPSNYDPASRTYSGSWDGTFKLAWTDNPAWIYRDLILNDRYGLGSVISAAQVDKWSLYQIAGYCDQMVDDGKGGTEPRFTCNLYLQSRSDALTVLQDMASIFRGMSYYAGSEVMVSADMPSDPVYTYTNSNVINGKFSRSASSGSTRYSVCKVSWSDRDDFGKVNVEYVQNQKAIVRYGIRETEVTAFGCTSQGQAQRLGHYILFTNQLETDTNSFSVGLDGTIARPGQIIRVADSDFQGKNVSGRIKAATASSITLDADVMAAAGDTLVVILPTGVAQTRVIQGFTGRVVTVTDPFSSVPTSQSIYTIESAELVAETYRILSVVENFGDDKLQYDVVAVQHNASKFAAIDSGAQIVTLPTTILPSAIQAIPTGVELSTFDSIKQGMSVATMRITWNVPVGAVSYNVWWRKGSSDWVYGGITYTNSLEVPGIYTGTYTARVSAVGVSGNSSLWGYSDAVELSGKTGTPPSVTSLITESLLFGIKINWTFPPGAEDTQRTEIWYGPANDLAAATKLADLAYPQSDYSMQQLKAGATLFFWARLVDRSGNIGPFYPVVDGVVGQASSDATAILDQIAGEVTKSALGQELLADIEKIDGNGPGSVNERIEETKAGLEQQVGEVNDAVTQARTELGQQIAGVGQSLTEVRNDLQGQIDSIADLADSMPYKPDQTYTAGQGVLGTDGVIYQATQAVPVGMPPPNTTYWLNVGQAVTTANGLATRVTTAETKITDIEGVNTAQSSTITGLQSALTGKADATAVNSLTTRVTTAESSITSQGQAITGLTNTVAGKADASALQALTTRVTSAEGVNTSQGTAITNLTNSVGGKADASAVQALTIRVTATEGKNTDQDASITSQGQAITSLSNTVAGKADASAVQALTTRVTSAEGVNTTQAGQITNLTTTVAGKADSSTVSALSNTVTQQGNDITAQGQALTNVTASIGSVGGENMLFNPSFERATSGMADGWALNGLATVAVSQVTSTLDPAGKAQRLDLTIPNASIYMDLSTGGAQEPKVSPGQIVTMSAYVRGTVGIIAQLYFQWKNAAGTILSTDGATSINLTADWQRFSRTSAAVPDGAASVRLLYRIRGPISGASITGFAEWDRAQFELSPVVSGWSDNNSLTDAAVTANAAATTALTTRVTQTETGLTSTSANIVTLTNNLASSGGDNLLPNSSFDQLAPDGTRPIWWRTDGSAGAVISVSQVDSPLSSSTKAVRCAYSGLANGGYIGLTYNIADGERPKVEAGKSYTLSVYARLSSPSARFAMYMQWIDAAGALIATTQLPETSVGTTFTRFQFTAVAPVNAARTQIFPARLINRSGAAADMWIEFDNVQLQEGAIATAYAPSVMLGDNAQSAATAALTSTVTQQGATLTSLSSQVTSLDNTINSVTDGLATKATSSALNALTSRVTNAEGVNTSQASSLTALKASITGEASPFSASAASWEFLSNLNGWTASVQAGSPTLVANPTFARLTGSGQFYKSSGIDVSGTLYPYLRMRFKRSGGTRTSCSMYWANQDGGLAEARRQNFTIDITTTDWQTVEIDLSAHAGWIGKTNTAIRLDVVNTADTAATFDMAYISIGSKSPSASALALSSTQATVTQQGTAITAQSTRIDTLSSTVGTNTAAIQSEATTRANADSALSTRVDGVQSTAGTASANAQTALTTSANTNNSINASYSVKLMTMDNGTKVAAGFGLGLGNESGVTQSTFAVSADRFVVLNSSLSGQVFSPFAVDGGQVFIADAFIKKATITNALIGQGINSATQTSYGQPVMSTDYAAGQITIQNKATQGKYIILREDGMFMVSGGVVMLELVM